MTRELFEIWEEEDYENPSATPWRAQMVNYVAQFFTKEKAEQYVAAVKVHRQKQ